MSTFLKSAGPGKPHRYRLRLKDGSKTPRIDCPLGMSEAEARKLANRMQAVESTTNAIYRDKLEHERPKPQGETVDTWFARYVVTKRCGESFRRVTVNVWGKWISPLVGPKVAASLTREDAEGLRDALDMAVKDRRLSPKSAANVWSTFTSAVKAMTNSKDRGLRVRDGLPNVLSDVLPPDPGQSASRTWIYPSEWQRLVSCEAVPIEWRRFYAVALYTGLRPGELQALRWVNVDLDARIISVVDAWDAETGIAKATKTEAGRRVVPIPATLLPVLRRMQRDGGALVTTLLDGRNTAAESIREHLRLANVLRTRLFQRTHATEPVDFRTLRDTYATWSALAGVPLRTLQSRMGHRQIGTTGRYVKEAEAHDETTVGAPFPELPPSLSLDRIPDQHPQKPGNMVARVGFEQTAQRTGLAFPRLSAGASRSNGSEKGLQEGSVDQILDRIPGPHSGEMALYAWAERAWAKGGDA